MRTNNLFPAFLALSACAFFHCTTMNMPVHNIMYPRDINSQWVQMASLDVSGIHLDTNQRPSRKRLAVYLAAAGIQDLAVN